MKQKHIAFVVLVAAASAATGTMAAGNHGGAPGNMPIQQDGFMPGQFPGAGHGGMAGMMNMMMQMHSQMMGDGNGPAMMRGPMMGGAGAMPMRAGQSGMMFGMATEFDTNQDGRTSADELRAGLTDRLTEFDADGDGALSLPEFEALHAAMIREMTVDRFQFFDSDGDGFMTEEEMHAPANRMSMMERFSSVPNSSDDMMGGQSDSMMNDN